MRFYKVQNQLIMKLFLTAVLLSFSTLGMANDATLNTTATTNIEAFIGSDRGNKKARRKKRANKKRKKRCASAARRNFAG
ncbi:MAG: hypothetical protein ACI865_000274 [Flavobacteriaceae bacterium]